MRDSRHKCNILTVKGTTPDSRHRCIKGTKFHTRQRVNLETCSVQCALENRIALHYQDTPVSHFCNEVERGKRKACFLWKQRRQIWTHLVYHDPEGDLRQVVTSPERKRVQHNKRCRKKVRGGHFGRAIFAAKFSFLLPKWLKQQWLARGFPISHSPPISVGGLFVGEYPLGNDLTQPAFCLSWEIKGRHFSQAWKEEPRDF